MDTSFSMSKGMMPQLVYVLLCPVFFIAFAMVYNPFGIKGYFDFGTHSYEFHLLILTGIILLVLLITRWM